MSNARYPAFFNFASDVVDHFANVDDGPALIWASSNGEEARFQFSDIARLATKLASSLAALGVRKGDRAIVMLPRIPEWQIAMVACLRLGAVPVPCIEMLTEKDIAYRVKHAGAKVVIARANQVAKFKPVEHEIAVRVAVGDTPGWHPMETLIASGSIDQAPAKMAADDLAAIYYTSGSTGAPKGVQIAARGLYLWRQSAVEWLDLKRNDIIWCTADTGWSKAGTSILIGPWSCGACSFFYDGPFDPAIRLRLLEHYRVSVYCASATELLRVLEQPVATADLSRLRRTVSAGEAVSSTLATRWHDVAGHQLAEAYGQTESLMSIGYRPGMPYRPGSAGQPLAHNEIAVIDDDGCVLPWGEEGDLAIRAPNPQLMLGYFGDPERTAACYVQGADSLWFVTGDRAVADEDGYLFLRGRRDDVINSSGYRIGPSEVEDALLGHPAVSEAAVVGLPDAERGEIVAAFIVLRPGHTPDDRLAHAIQDAVKAATAPYKYPRLVRFVAELPKTPTGKIQRNILRQGDTRIEGVANPGAVCTPGTNRDGGNVKRQMAGEATMPDTQIPVEHLFTLTLQGLDDEGHDFLGPFGRRKFTRAKGGSVEGAQIKGKVLELLATNYGRVSIDGAISQFEAELTLQVEDDTIILMEYRGRMSPMYGAGQSRINALFHVAEGPHEWLNEIQAIGYGTEHNGIATFEIYALQGGPEQEDVSPDSATDLPRRSVSGEFLFRRKSEHNPGAERHIIKSPLSHRYLTLAEGGGAFSGPRLSGEFLPGYSWSPHRMGIQNGKPLMRYDVKTLLRTEDGVPILMSYVGVYSQRYPEGSWVTATLFETDDGPYAWLNQVQAIGFGRWAGDGAEYRVYALR